MWPPTTKVDSLVVTDSRATVRLSGPLTMKMRTADSLDVQQLMHTITAAVPDVAEVAIDVAGGPWCRAGFAGRPPWLCSHRSGW